MNIGISFLSIFGISTTVTFYLFIANHAKGILENKRRIPFRAYVFQPVIIFLFVAGSFVYFQLLKGGFALDGASLRVIGEIYLVSVIVSIFQVHNWRLLALRENDSVGFVNMMMLVSAALVGLLAAFFLPSESLLYLLLAILLLIITFGLKRGASNV